jgi:hydrogenase/urease accessory protein HupE
MKRVVLLILLIFSLGSNAHPGHGLVESGLAHWLMSAEHLLLLFAVVVLAFASWRKRATEVK